MINNWMMFADDAEARKYYEERNTDIYERFVRGEKYADLAHQFDLSPARISQICMKHKRRNLRKPQATMINTYTYLASPYTAPDVHTMELRALGATRACHWLLTQRHWVYSPIVHCHDLAKTFSLPREHEYWEEYNCAMLRGASDLVVLAIAGWRESRGVQAEIAYAGKLTLPTKLLRLQGFAYYFADMINAEAVA